MKNQRIAIVGGGIGGLTTAIALKKFGFQTTVFEAAPQLSEVGAGIWLGPNAMNVLQEIGVGASIRAVSNELMDVRIETYKKDLISRMPTSEMKRRFGYGNHAIHRAVLQAELMKAIAKEDIRLDHRLSSVQQGSEGVTLAFENETTETFDIVIAADGVKSKVRTSVFGETKYRYSGQTCFRGIIKKELPDDEKQIGAEVWGQPGGLRASISQVGDGKVYFWFTMKWPAGSRYSGHEAKKVMMEKLKDFKGNLYPVISGVDPEAIIQTDLYDFKPIKQWYKDRVVLLGDAAHATTPNLGQGASQAIEDAYALALSFSKHETPEEAFSWYQSQRIDKASYIVNTSYQMAQLTNWGGRIPFTLKKWIMSSTPQRVVDKQLDKIYSNRLLEGVIRTVD